MNTQQKDCFTSPPWRLRKFPNPLCESSHWIEDEDGNWVACINRRDDEQHSANANLIVAAPELYAELKAYVNAIQRLGGKGTHRQIAALAKAEGRVE